MPLTGRGLLAASAGIAAVRAAVAPAPATGSGRTLVIGPGGYRETVVVDPGRTDVTWIGAAEDPGMW